MKILVANLGSTSFKYRLFDLTTESQLARGGIDRIGQAESQCSVEIGAYRQDFKQNVKDHAAAVGLCFDQLTDSEHGCLKSVSEVAGIGFKAVFAGKFSGVRVVTEDLLREMERLSDIAPAHNPPYVKAMRQLQSAFPGLPLVAALETAFHETIPLAHRCYAIPDQWRTEYSVQRWGFHGASHRFISTRMSQILGREDLKLVSCHLGGSNSLCAVKHGKSIATTMGMSPQGGLPNNNRVGDFDAFALPVLLRETGKPLPQLLDELSSKGGLLGLSGLSGDVRDLEEAEMKGSDQAKLALDVFVASIRLYLGGYMAYLEGAEVIVFTAGIGENSVRVRRDVCKGFEWAGLKLDHALNEAPGKGERKISRPDSQIQVWVVPTNEEIVVARQTAEVISNK